MDSFSGQPQIPVGQVVPINGVPAPQPPSQPDRQSAADREFLLNLEKQLLERFHAQMRWMIIPAGILLAFAGFLLHDLVPSFLTNRIDQAVATAVDARFTAQKGLIESLRGKSEDQLAENLARIKASGLELDNRDKAFKGQYDQRSKDLLDELGRREDQAETLATTLGEVDARIKTISNIDVNSLVAKIQQVANIAGQIDAGRYLDFDKRLDDLKAVAEGKGKRPAIGIVPLPEVLGRGREIQRVHSRPGMARVYEIDVDFKTPLNQPVVIAEMQRLVHRDGLSDDLIPSAQVLVTKTTGASCTLRVSLWNPELFVDGQVVWMAFDSTPREY